MSDGGSDDEFGDASWVVEKDTFTVVDRVEIEHSPSGRGDKRRRLNPSPQVGLRNSHRSTDDSEEDFDPPGHPARSVEQTLAPADDQVNDEGNDHPWSRRPRQRAHVPKQAESPETTYQLGTQAPASSPYRIRGPRWKIPKSAPTRIISTTPVADASCRPTTPQRRRLSPDSSSDDDAFDPSPYPAGTGSALGCQGRSTVTPTKKPSTFAKLGDGPSNTPTRASLSSPAQFVSGTPPNQPGLRTDIVGELENLPSDAFDSEPPSDTPHDESSHSQAVGPGQTGRRLVGPKSGLRQTTLFSRQGTQPAASASLVERQSNFPEPAKKEPPTHHKLNRDALKKWVYPTNLGTIRDYQFNIVQRGLFHNLLVALPTGLGKTFIAATIMLNWLRWTQDAQIVFVAPTKPLVAQQIEACYGIVGIPRSQTTMLTGGVSPGIRDEEWANKRVFFMTPQTFINDLKHGRADPKRIVCVVVDEAHRATGGYAYVEVVRFIRRFNQSFRVLALTATPGASIEAVQEVIDGLDISRVEIRTEESLDIRTYVHRRNVEVVTFDPSEDMIKMKELYSKALQPVLNKLNEANAYWVKDPLSLTAFGLTKARMGWMGTAGKTASPGLRGMMMAIFSVLASRAHSITLLNYHGIGPFYHNLLEFRKELEGGRKGSKYSKQIAESPHFRELMDQGQRWINDAEFVGHPKLAYLREIVMNHFLDAGEGRGAVGEAPPPATRIMIFCHYRDSAEEVVRVLKRNMPTIRPSAFVGQAGAKGSEGMSQKVQTAVISNFQKGIFNTLVATSVGEEGLDIGEVDLIICYDSSASPIRMLQRMGRTGRKRAGNIKLLLMRGKEEDSFAKAKDIYEGMQQQIATGTKFTFHDERSPRILPKDIQPEVDKRIIDIPVENTQAEMPEPTRRGKKPKKAAPKKFHMPDGVNTGFVKASRVGGEGDEMAALMPEDEQAVFLRHQLAEDELTPVPSLEDVLLTKAQEKELERRFRDVADGGCGGSGDGNDASMVSVARLDAFPARQRTLGRTRRIGHGQSCERAVRLFNTIHNVNDDTIRRLQAHVPANERGAGDKDDPRVLATRRRTKPHATENSSLTSDTDETSKDADAEKLRPAQRRPISPEELDEEVEPNENDRDMEGFINDESEQNTDSSPRSISTPPSLIDHDTRFFISPKKPAGGRANSDSSLPDFSTLVSTFRPDETDLEEVMEEAISDNDQELVTMTQRRRGRQVLQDSDDSL